VQYQEIGLSPIANALHIDWMPTEAIEQSNARENRR